MTEFNCADIERLRNDYVEASLLPEVVEQFETHVSGCPACSESVARLRAVDGGIRALPTPLPTASEWAAVLANARRHRTSWRRLAAAVILAIALPASLATWYGRSSGAECPCDVFTPGLDADF